MGRSMIYNELTARCHTCDEDTDWAIVHRYVDYHGITHCYRCTKCGKVVPSFSWLNYQETGKIVIPL